MDFCEVGLWTQKLEAKQITCEDRPKASIYQGKGVLRIAEERFRGRENFQAESRNGQECCSSRRILASSMDHEVVLSLT